VRFEAGCGEEHPARTHDELDGRRRARHEFSFLNLMTARLEALERARGAAARDRGGGVALEFLLLPGGHGAVSLLLLLLAPRTIGSGSPCAAPVCSRTR